MSDNRYYDELDDFERRIEENAEKFKRVENVEYWKKVIEKAAENTLKKKKMLVLEFESQEDKEKAISILRENFGKGFEVVESVK